MSDAVCCPLDGNDGEPATASWRVVRRSRRLRKCGECRCEIGIGQCYESYRLISDGSFDAYVTCLPCVAVRSHFDCGGGWYFGMIWENIRENFFPTMQAGGPCMDGMSPEGKQKLFEEYFKWFYDGGYKQRQWWLAEDERAIDIAQASKEKHADR